MTIRRCPGCSLRDTTPGIEFRENKICNYCITHQKIEYRGEDELLKTLDAHRNQSEKYDCIVPVSGGRDSSFTLLKMVKDYKMNVLAVNYESPFTHPQATENVKNAAKALNIDVIFFFFLKRIHERTFSSNLKTWMKNPSFGVFPLLCVACKLFWYETIKIAKKHKVRCIVAGLNRYEDTSYKKALLGISTKESWEKTYIKSFFGMLKEIVRNPGYFKLAFIPTMIKAYLFGDSYALGFRIFAPEISILDLFYYLPWNEKENLTRISSELGWKPAEEYNSTWRFDCKVAQLKDLVFLNTFGITEKDDLYAKMVREGIISYDEALERLKLENKIHEKTIKEVLEKAGIDYESFLKFLEGISKASPNV
ncbi:MAG: ATPase [Deltaproteobacteria bacterium]|nr:ATPase [Deltaproteobacteria bacterium]